MKSSSVVRLQIAGMTCSHCVQAVKQALSTLEGVHIHYVQLHPPEAKVSFDPQRVKLESIVQAIKQAGYEVVDWEFVTSPAAMEETAKHLVIIGGGSAAFAAAIRANELGARVTLINEGLPIGGTCVNVGCVPSKALIRAAEAHWHAAHHPFKGIRSWSTIEDFGAIIRQKQELVETLRKLKYEDILAGLEGVTYIKGWASVVSPTEVEVNGDRISADYILIATGSSPFIPPIEGIDRVPYLTNNELFEQESLPESMLIVGGNYIGLEVAQMYARFGSRVTVVERMLHILPLEMEELSSEVQQYLEAEGISFETGFEATQVWQEEGVIYLKGLDKEGQEKVLQASHLVVAAGRRGNTERLNLESVGVEVDRRGFLKVNDYLQTSVPTIYGAGDVIGEPLFVYKAAYDGKLAVENALQASMRPRDYSAMPYVMFTEPQVAGVGLDERQAMEQGIPYEATVLPVSEIPRAQAAHESRGFIKLIRHAETDRLIGTRIVAPEGGEIIMEAVLAIKYGVTTQEMTELFHPYLTLAEGMKLAALTFRKDVHKLSCCAV